MGKFESKAAEKAYEITLNGCCEEMGSVDENGMWYGKVEEMKAIVSEDSQGFVYLTKFSSIEALEKAWKELEEEINFFEEE